MVRFTPETYEKLTREAKLLAVPPAVLVRSLITQLLDKSERPMEPVEWPEGERPSRAERRRIDRERKKGAR
jgi:hypothetical protein